MSLRIRGCWIALLSISAPTLLRAQTKQSNVNTASLQQIQRQYQKLVQDLNTEEGNIQQKRAEYGQESIVAIQDTIQDLTGIIKKTPPGEDKGEDPIAHYLEFFQKARELADMTIRQLNNIADSKTSLTEKDLRLQKLNQSLVKATATLRDIVDISKAVRNRPVRLHELPELSQPPELDKDYSELDKAIAEMDQADKNHLNEFAAGARVAVGLLMNSSLAQDVLTARHTVESFLWELL
jgi:hypothetical protein